MTSIPRRRSLLAASVTVLALGSGLLPPSPAAAAADAGPARQAGGSAYDVTLITGDVVHVTDLPGRQDAVTVDRPDGAAGGVRVQQSGAGLVVLPDEALPLLASGAVDRRLFDVSALAAAGYGDGRTGAIPLIATAAKGRGRPQPPAAPEGARAVRTLQSIDATALRADKSRARAFWQDIAGAPGAQRTDRLLGGIGKLWLDGRVEADLADSVPQVRAPRCGSRATTAAACGFERTLPTSSFGLR